MFRGWPSARKALPTRPDLEVSWCGTIKTGQQQEGRYSVDGDGRAPTPAGKGQHGIGLAFSDRDGYRPSIDMQQADRPCLSDC